MKKLILIRKFSRNSRPLAWKLENRWSQRWGDLPASNGCLDGSRGSYRASPSSGDESAPPDDATRKSMPPASSHTSSTGMRSLTGQSESALIRTENTLLVSSFNFASCALSSSRPIPLPSMLAFPSRSAKAPGSSPYPASESLRTTAFSLF